MQANPSFAQSAFEDPGARTPTGGTGDLVSVENRIDGGSVLTGASSQVVVLFRNDSARPIESGAINLYPSSNVSAEVSMNQCAQEPLPSGAVCAIALSVKGLQPGAYRIEMLMRHDGKARLITSTITGSVDGTGAEGSELVSDLETIPTELDFGSLSASRSQVRSVILRNVTSQTVGVEDIVIESSAQSGFTQSHNCSSLATGEACIVTITWAPLQSGPATGILVVNHSGPTGIASVTLDGSYEPDVADAADVFPEAVPGKGLLVSSQTEVDFGSGISTSSAITVSLVNVGDADLGIRDIILSNNENGIQIDPNGCRSGTILEPVEACPLTLTWEPTREGSILDDIQIVHNGARGILVLPVRGDAAQAVNKDAKAIVLGEGLLRSIPTISEEEFTFDEPDTASVSGPSVSDEPLDRLPVIDREPQEVPEPQPVEVDVTGVLEGFAVTSYAPNRAIIAGPGGSRVVFDGEETVIGGVLWTVKMRPSAVEFSYGKQRVLLLFDRSLSSINRNSSQSINVSTSDSNDDN